LSDGPGDREPANRQQIRHREVQADPEHHEHDADLGQLAGHGAIRDIARHEGADDDTGREITDQWRQPQPLRQESEHEGEGQTDGDRGDQGDIMCHGRSPVRRDERKR
jgi:hypothetical protein